MSPALILAGHPDAVVAFIKERKWAAFDCLLTIPLSVMGFIVLLDTDGNTFQNINMHDFLWCYPIWRITRIAEAVSACVNFADMTDIMSARLGSLTVAEAPDLSYHGTKRRLRLPTTTTKASWTLARSQCRASRSTRAGCVRSSTWARQRW